MKHRFSRRLLGFDHLPRLRLPNYQDAIVLGSLWVISTFVTCVWLWLDRAVPGWDDSAHLSGALGYWQILQHPDLFSGDWWTALWQKAPSYRAPFIYIATVPFLNLFGRGADQAVLVNLLFIAIVMLSVYYLGTHLFDRSVGLWAAVLCLLFPGLATLQTRYLLDYGIAALIALTFTVLTIWRDAARPKSSWLLSVAWGISFGIIMLAKATSFLFFVFPGVWLLVAVVRDRRWLKLVQGIIALGIAWLLCGSWYRLNWLTIITSATTANNAGIAEGDPSFRTLAGWLYYWEALPEMVSYPLLLVPIGCFLAGWVIQRPQQRTHAAPTTETGGSEANPSTINKSTIGRRTNSRSVRWLVVFCVGGYVFCSLSTNKDVRFITPLLPMLAIVLAYWFTRWQYRWVAGLRWATTIVSFAVLLLNWFPLGGWVLPGASHQPDRSAPLPHEQVIAAIAEAAPYMRSTIGMVPNTDQINPFNMDFYGRLAAFQVYARELIPSRASAQDARSMDWYLTKSGRLGAPEKETARKALQKQIEQNPDLQLYRTWALPNDEQLRLYRRLPLKMPPIAVAMAPIGGKQVTLEVVTLTQPTSAKDPQPVTYQWSGSWAQLQQGIVVLTWQAELEGGTARWFHDHGLGLGQLYAGDRIVEPTQGFRVVEQLAMLPPTTAATPSYRLQARYLNRQTGETYPLSVPPVRSDNTATTQPNRVEPDLTVQLYQLGDRLAQGKFDAVMQQVGRLNLYDPIGDYLVQAEKALTDRLQQEPQNRAIAYTLALAQALQRRVQPTLTTLEYLTRLDAQNPYLWMYLGVVRLYDWQGQAAEQALNVAEQLQPSLPDLKTMRAIAAIMQLNVLKAFTLLQSK